MQRLFAGKVFMIQNQDLLLWAVALAKRDAKRAAKAAKPSKLRRRSTPTTPVSVDEGPLPLIGFPTTRTVTPTATAWPTKKQR